MEPRTWRKISGRTAFSSQRICRMLWSSDLYDSDLREVREGLYLHPEWGSIPGNTSGYQLSDAGWIYPDCGAMCAAISLSTGKQPKYVGKPFKETVDMVLTLTGSEREKISFVGDRLYTDVKTGVANGATGFWCSPGRRRSVIWRTLTRCRMLCLQD